MKHILLVTIVFLTASSAHAGDSWVLWEGTMTLGDHQPYEWKIITAFPTYNQCRTRHKKDFAIIKKINRTATIDPETLEIKNSEPTSAKGNERVTQKCLPGNVDPRN